MKPSEERLDLLLNLYFDQRISDEQKQELWSYVNNPEYARRIKANIPEATAHQQEGATLKTATEERILNFIFGYGTEQPLKVKRMRLWPRIAVAAALATLIFGAGLFYFSGRGDHNGVYASDVAPGKQGATLMLANGKKILINEVSAGNVASQGAVKISKTKDGRIVYEAADHQSGELQYNTLSTTRGQQTQLRLPDGSLVVLNAASSLRYPTSFANSSHRRVTLTGEGYFEITKDKLHPFIVATGNQQVQVLGTHFNINGYADEHGIATTLLEGSVKVTSSGQQKVIKPGQQAVSAGNAIQVASVDVESIIDWKDGDFYLNNVDFRVAMRKIARWYDLEVVYDESVPADIESTGYISRTNKLSAVLRLIEKSGQVHFKVEGKRLYVSK
jgi:transmembrane sensor